MATESFLKNVTIRKPTAARGLVRALEHSHKKARNKVRMSRSVVWLRKEKIKDFFGDV